MNILNWNCRGLNSTRTRHILRDLISDNKIDIVAIQETKKDDFSHRCLKGISSRIDIWQWLPSIGRSGGILLGCDSNKVRIISYSLHTFCIDVVLENKLDNKI